MIAIGLTPSCFTPPPCIPVRCGSFQLICAPVAEAASPRDRMRLHLACARHLPILLPFAPARETGSDMAVSWCEAQHDRIEAALARLQDGRQLSLDARAVLPATAPKEASGAAWLKRRAAVARDRAQALVALRAGVGMACDALQPRDRCEETRDGGFQLHLLFGRTEGVVALAALQDSLAPVPGWALTVTGPWPPYDFTALGEIA